MAEIINRLLEIRFPNNDHDTIKSENIVAESMVITRSLCDGNFNLGGCIATSCEIQLIGILPDSIQGKRIQVVATQQWYADEAIYPSDTLTPGINKIYPGMHPLLSLGGRYFFTGTIDTAKRQSNRQIVKVTAYDDLYILGNKNVYTWFYNFALNSPDGKITDLTSSLLSSQLSDLQYYNLHGRNGNDKIALNLSASLVENKCKGNLLALDVLKAICELTNCFGYINEKGVYYVVDIKGNNANAVSISTYESLSFEEYETQIFDGIVLCYGENKRYIYGRASSYEQPSCYYCKDNVIANCCKDSTTAGYFGKNLADASRLLNQDYCYRPFSLKIDDNFAKDVKLGSKVKIATGFSTGDVQYVNSFVLKDRITGIVNLTHEFSAEGEKVQTGYDSEAI